MVLCQLHRLSAFALSVGHVTAACILGMAERVLVHVCRSHALMQKRSYNIFPVRTEMGKAALVSTVPLYMHRSIAWYLNHSRYESSAL